MFYKKVILTGIFPFCIFLGGLVESPSSSRVRSKEKFVVFFFL